MRRRNKEEFFEDHIIPLYKVVLSYAYSRLKSKEPAEDATQQAMEKAWQNFDQLRDRNKYKQWVMQIAHNEIRHFYRDQQPQAQQTVDVESLKEEGLELKDALAEDELYEMIQKETLCQLFYGLKEAYKSVIVLHLLHGFTFAEIAEVMDMNPNTVRSNYIRGLALVKERHSLLAKEQE